MHFIPESWLELAAANRPMSVYSRVIDEQPAVSEIEVALLALCHWKRIEA
jgi:hypothetical protein